MNPVDIPGLPPGVPEFLRESGIESLYPPQAEAVDAGITEGESLVASVPTASGKTLIAELAMLSSVERGGKALYVVPLRALASEKKAEFERWADFDVDVGISTGNYESSEEWLSSRDIVVATSEKVDSLVRNGAPWIDDLTCVVADEVHLVDDPNRGPTLEVTLAKLRRINPDLQVVALSATVDNADEVAEWLGAELVKSDWRPVDLRTGVHYGGAITFDDDSQREVPVGRGERATAALVDDTLDEDGSSLVFVNSRRNAEAAARRLADVTADHLTDEERSELADIADDIAGVSDTETSDDLAAVVAKGAAFHHAGLCVAGKTRILRPDGTFENIRSLVERSDDPGEAIGMREMRMEGTDITDTFKMGKRPTLTVETRTGNALKLSKTHPLPVLREEGVKWIPAGELSEGEYIARPRHLRLGPDTPPSLRNLVSGNYRVYREYETVDRLSDPLDERELPSSYRTAYARNRNITVEDFRTLAEKNGTSASTLFSRVIADGGQSPIRIPERVDEDFCWLAGAVAGDGYLNDHEVVLTGKSALLDEFDRIIREQFDRPTYTGESPSGTPYCKLNSVVVSDILREHFGILRKEAGLRLPKVGLPDDQFGAYVSGLFDADGSVSQRDNADGSPCVELYSTSTELITDLKTALLRYGIVAFRDRRDTEDRTTEHAGRTIRSKNDVHRLTIYGVEQLRRFEENIGFRHAEKSKKLRCAIDQNPVCERGQNDVVPASLGKRVRRIRHEQGASLAELEPEVPKATLSRFERGITPMKRSTFQSVASQLEDSVLNAVAASEVFWDKVTSVEPAENATLYDLSTKSSNFIANGIVAHNTSEHRSLVEDAFRNRLLKVIAATPTLAAGVNTPSRRVIVRDWRRYDGEFGGMKPLDVLEVHQMFGRAGRPGLDPYGEAVLLANDHDTMDELFDRYVHADPEPVQSKLAREPAMRTHLLATISSGFARTRDGLLDFLDRTLYATQSSDTARLESVVDSTIDYLVANEFVEREGDEITATGLGHTVSRLYLDPMSAAEIVDGLRAAEDPTPLGLYHLVSRTPDMYELYLKSGDRETYTELCYEREAEFLGRVPSEFEDVRFEEWLSALKTAKLLEDWAREVDEDRLTERYGVGPGDIRGKVDTAEWLLGAAERLATDLELDCVVAVREAKKRVQYGVRDELLDLAGVRNVGRKRARRLYEAGVESRADLREADKSVILGALRGRERTAERILENAGRRDPSMEDVRAEGEGEADTDAETGEGRTGDGDADTGGQASLGDFG